MSPLGRFYHVIVSKHGFIFEPGSDILLALVSVSLGLCSGKVKTLTLRLDQARRELNRFSNRRKATVLGRFFKTGPGGYGEGDTFIGVAVPDTRRVAREFCDLSQSDVKRLLTSLIHEERLLALFILNQQYVKGRAVTKRWIYDLYLTHTQYINNWDLVDSSAPNIVGRHLFERSRRPLYKLARSRNLWERRIAILATLFFIKNDDFDDTLAISEILLADDHDLIHKAVGWMLRETGKRDLRREETFLASNYRRMPRTMLRYAIEKFPEQKRQRYLKGRI